MAEVATAVAGAAAYVPLAETRVQLIAGQRLHNGLVMQPYSGYDLATAGSLTPEHRSEDERGADEARKRTGAVR